MSEPTVRSADFDSVQVTLLSRFARDRAAGRARSLAEYLALFPGREEETARAWLGLRETPRTEPARVEGESRTIGPYRLIEELGRGGQAIVWLAEDTRIGRLVALKTVPRSPLFGELAPRLQREAQALARLEHAGLGQVYDVGAAEGAAWIAMRLERGRTLHERIASGDTAARPASELVGWIEGAARALHAAHEAGFLHRDIKPSNLMVRDDGQVVVLDFGIATSDDAPGHLTLTGDAVGTPAYMAPEVQSTGRGPIDRRADVWSLGVTLYEALAGRRPFEAATREAESRRALHEAPAPLAPARVAGLRRADVELLLATALAKDAELRYATAGALADDLARLCRREPLATRRPSALRLALRWARRRPGLAAAVVALVVCAVTAMSLYAHSQRQLRAFHRLADLAIAHDLVAARPGLFPISPAKAPELDLWVARAEELFEREAQHRATIASLAPSDGRLWARGDESGEGWMREQLEELLATLERLRAHHAFIVPQARLANDLDRLLRVEHAEAWAAAAQRVAADARFPGFKLTPQRGLQPLGPDPESGLEEFAHLPTGAPAERDPATGRVALAADSGLVFVLVPCGETVVGVSAPGAGLEHPDPHRAEWDGPPQRVRLAPFLISKFELTQGQWRARTGRNPSRHQTDQRESRYLRGDSLRHPVEYVTQLEVEAVLAEMGLALPTETQWEHCARAGTTTPWSFGADPTVFATFGNIADQSAQEINAEVGWDLTEGVRDGHIVHAPVGSFAPNPWGLFDVHGNVFELTRSTYEDLAQCPPQDGEGETARNYDLVVERGGSFNQIATLARSSYRSGHPLDVKSPWTGVRPLLRYSP